MTSHFNHRGGGAHVVHPPAIGGDSYPPIHCFRAAHLRRGRSSPRPTGFFLEALAPFSIGLTRTIFASPDTRARRENRSTIAETATPRHSFVDIPRERFEPRSPATSAHVVQHQTWRTKSWR